MAEAVGRRGSAAVLGAAQRTSTEAVPAPDHAHRKQWDPLLPAPSPPCIPAGCLHLAWGREKLQDHPQGDVSIFIPDVSMANTPGSRGCLPSCIPFSSPLPQTFLRCPSSWCQGSHVSTGRQPCCYVPLSTP